MATEAAPLMEEAEAVSPRAVAQSETERKKSIPAERKKRKAASAEADGSTPGAAMVPKRAAVAAGDTLAAAMKAKKCKRSVTSSVGGDTAAAVVVDARPPPSTIGTTGEGDLGTDRDQVVDDATFGKKEELGENVVMCMRTLQAAQWRTLVDALKDLVPQCPVEFDHKGMRLVSMDPGHVAMIHLQALSEFYYCKAPITIGLNVVALYKMLRNLTTAGYMLEFTLTSDSPEHLIIRITNGDKKTVTINKLKLRRLDDESYDIPKTTFNRVLSIPSTDFQRYIRELSAVSKRITIKSTRNVLILSATGTDGSTSIEIKPTPSGMHWTHIDPVESGQDDVVQGSFFSKYLERFARPLDNIVEIFIKQDYPLVVRYVMATAIVRLVIGQIADDEEAGAEQDMQDED